MAETTIRADGKSPLTCYVGLLVSVPVYLELRLNRDAEAVRILTAAPALPEAIRRAERWYWDRQREKQNGGIVLTQRFWTRRDERRVNMLMGLSEGYGPSCRAARYLRRVSPSSDHLLREAVDEARRDGTAATICGKLDEAHATFNSLLNAAWSITNDDGGQSDFEAVRQELGPMVCELMRWTKPARTESGADNEAYLAVVRWLREHLQDRYTDRSKVEAIIRQSGAPSAGWSPRNAFACAQPGKSCGTNCRPRRSRYSLRCSPRTIRRPMRPRPATSKGRWGNAAGECRRKILSSGRRSPSFLIEILGN